MYVFQFGWCLRLGLMVMLLSLYLLIAALITTGSTYGRGVGMFSYFSSGHMSPDSNLNKSVMDSQTMERALQSKSMAVAKRMAKSMEKVYGKRWQKIWLAVNQLHTTHRGLPPMSRKNGRFPEVSWCKPLGYRADIPQRDSVVALASFPGSGNTWVRYLLQQTTGIITGSVYKEHTLLRNGFPGESVTDASVLAVKTHDCCNPNSKFIFNKVILIVRDPYEALKAEFNRQSGGHVGHASANIYKRQNGKHWKSFVYKGAIKWANTNTYWYNSFPDPSTRHVIFYDKLVNDTQHELERILDFLNIDIARNQMKCAITHKEGLHHRAKKKVFGVELFDAKMRQTIDVTKERVYKLLKSKPDIPLLSSTTEPN